MQRHLTLLRGLILLTELRLSEHDAVKKELGITTVEGREPLYALRSLLQTKYMPGDTKARILFDEFQEIDLYVTGPLELYFCLAQALVDRYRHLTADDPTLCHPDLDCTRSVHMRQVRWDQGWVALLKILCRSEPVQ